MHREGHPEGPAGSEEVKNSQRVLKATNSSVWQKGRREMEASQVVRLKEVRAEMVPDTKGF